MIAANIDPMEMLTKIFYIYYSLINIIAFFVMVSDKNKAINQQYRIPEKTLFGLAWLGGSTGIWLAMKLWRHKTLHASFRFGIPAIFMITSFFTYLVYTFIQQYGIPKIHTYMNEMRNEGGILSLILYPFYYDTDGTASSIYWSSFWAVIVTLLILTFSYYILSKPISFKFRVLLAIINLYFFILIVFKCLFGVINSESLLKAIILILIPLSFGLIKEFIFGFIRGFKGSIAEEHEKIKNNASISNGLPTGNQKLLDNLTHLNQNLFQSGFLQQVGPEKLDFHNNPIQEHEKVYFPMFGASLFQRENLPCVCEIEPNKAFHKAGINLANEIVAMKRIDHKEETRIETLADIEQIYNHLVIGDEIIFQVLVGRGTVNERVQNIFLKVESHLNLVNS